MTTIPLWRVGNHACELVILDANHYSRLKVRLHNRDHLQKRATSLATRDAAIGVSSTRRSYADQIGTVPPHLLRFIEEDRM
jgi:hypothetical protein